MRRLTRSVAFCLAAGVLAVSTVSAVEVMWRTDLDAAFRMAKAENRPLLLHFWSPDCVPCMQLENRVFNRDDVGRTLSSFFVAVKINAKDDPQLAARYRIRSVPQDVILTPGDKELHRMTTPQDADQYVAQLSAVAFRSGMMPHRKPRQQRFADLSETGYQASTGYQSALGPPPGDPPIGMDRSEPIDHVGPIGVNDPELGSRTEDPQPEAREVINRFASRTTVDPVQSAPSRAGFSGEVPQSDPRAGTESELPLQIDMAATRRSPRTSHAQVAMSADRAVSRSETPPFGLDGYCPVTLLKRDVWKKGDPRFGVIHRGRTYLFTSEVAKKEFMATPDDFSPVLAGIDPVLLADGGEAVEGRRAHGIVYRKRVFLFTTEENLQRFWQEPESYAAPIRQAMESGTVNRLFR